MNDRVEHPSHYTCFGSAEVIDIAELIAELQQIRNAEGELPVYTYTSRGLLPPEPGAGPLVLLPTGEVRLAPRPWDLGGTDVRAVVL